MPQFQCAGQFVDILVAMPQQIPIGDAAEDSGNSTHPIHGQSCGRSHGATQSCSFGSKSSENVGGNPEPQCINIGCRKHVVFDCTVKSISDFVSC